MSYFRLFIFVTIFSFYLVESHAAKVIGVTTDYRDNKKQDNNFANTSFYALRDNYVFAFQKACKKYDVTVIILPLDKSMIKSYVNLIDGLVITGNYYDVNPKLYGQEKLNDTVKINDYKGDFERELFQEFYKSKKPVFGICGGYQMINVALGGELYQDIPTQVQDSNINHSTSGKYCVHDVNIIEQEGVFKQIVSQLKSDKVCVNSVHHQAVSKLADGLEATAIAPDNIIEAYKSVSHPFLIGVQWHPEYELSKFDTELMQEFCKVVGEAH